MKMLIASLILCGLAAPCLAQCPSCPGPVCPVPVRPEPQRGPHYDPYGVSYASLVGHVQTGARGILVVGIPDRWVGTYQLHCSVPAGFAGLVSGEYECYRGPDGRPWMRLNVPARIPDAVSRASCQCEKCTCADKTKCPQLCPVTTCSCCKPTCTCAPGKTNGDCECYPCKCNR